MQMLQLVNCADTIVGDGMMRGISGGERKRVTTGEIVVGPSKVLFMDEISTGLDSASTFTIVQSLANLVHATDSTIVVALLQPEPQVPLSKLSISLHTASSHTLALISLTVDSLLLADPTHTACYALSVCRHSQCACRCTTFLMTSSCSRTAALFIRAPGKASRHTSRPLASKNSARRQSLTSFR
jgi:hypothetical protein